MCEETSFSCPPCVQVNSLEMRVKLYFWEKINLKKVTLHENPKGYSVEN